MTFLSFGIRKNFHIFGTRAIVLGILEKNEHFLRSVAARLRVWREKRGVTQEEVYLDTGVHVGRIETGRSNLTVSTLHALCLYYGVSLSKFFEDFPDYSKKSS